MHFFFFFLESLPYRFTEYLVESNKVEPNWDPVGASQKKLCKQKSINYRALNLLDKDQVFMYGILIVLGFLGFL